MAARRIGVGIVGLSARGGWGARAHLPALRALPERFEVVGLCGSRPDAAAAAAVKYGIGFHTADPGALAEAPDVDLIVVAVKVPDHAAIVRAALAAGKAVLCEWPLAVDAAEAGALTALAQARGVQAFVGLQARAAPAVQHVRALAADGFVGAVRSIDVRAAVGMPWNGTTDSARTYLNDARNGATMRSIPLAHMLDCLEYVFGDIAEAHATETIRRPRVHVTDRDAWIGTDVADHIVVNGTFAAGPPVSLTCRGGDSAAGSLRWEITGSRGSLVITAASGHVQFGALTIAGRTGDAAMQPVAVPVTEQLAGVADAPHVAAVAGAYLAIADALRGAPGRAPTFGHALRLHRLIEAMAGH